MEMAEEPSGARSHRIAVIHNADYEDRDPLGEIDRPPTLEADAEVAVTAAHIAEVLASAGWEPCVLKVHDRLDGLPGELARRGVGAVFNLVESLGSEAAREREVPLLLESLRLPYTGNGPRALRLANAKDACRAVLAAHHIRVPRGLACMGVEDLPDPAAHGLRFPLFVKPARTDASIGIDQGSVVRDLAQLKARVAWLDETLTGPYLVEEYLPGREINVAIFPDPFDDGFLVPTEIDFSGYPKDFAPIVTYDCKWRPGSPEYVAHSVPARDRLSPRLLREVLRTARAAFLAIGGTSYGRVDLRLDTRGWPSVVDVNPNNDLDHEAGLAVAARSVGLDYPALIEAVAMGATLKANHVPAPAAVTRSRALVGVAAPY
jgi:D-alanine-D-alanine ligase